MEYSNKNNKFNFNKNESKNSPSTIERCAFTLAEVLITLGIIGVVAAMTLPTLVKKYQQNVVLNKLKSTYSALNNALERAKAMIQM